MIQLIIYAVMAAAAAFAIHAAWSGFKDSIAAPYVQAQIAADQPKIAKAEKGQADAEGERDRARNDTAACVASAKTQSDAVTFAENKAKAAIQASKELRAKQALEEAEAAPRIAELRRRAAAAPKLMVCEEELTKTRDTLREALRIRRGLPAVPPATPPASPPAPVLVK